MKKWLGLGMGAVVLLVAVSVGAVTIINEAPDIVSPNMIANMNAAVDLQAQLDAKVGLNGLLDSVLLTVVEAPANCGIKPSGQPAWGSNNGAGSGCINATECENGGPAGTGLIGCLEETACHEATESVNGQICDDFETTSWSMNGLQLADCDVAGTDMITFLSNQQPAPTPTGGPSACNTATTPLAQCLCESSEPAWQKGCYATFGGGRSVTPTLTGTPPVVPPTPSVPPSPSACSAAVTALDQCLCESSNPAWQEGCYATFGGGRVVTPAPTPTPVATPRRSPAPTATFVAHPTPTPNLGCPGITPLQQCLCESNNPAWQQGCKAAF
jgi:hypothetical protein